MNRQAITSELAPEQCGYSQSLNITAKRMSGGLQSHEVSICGKYYAGYQKRLRLLNARQFLQKSKSIMECIGELRPN